MLHSAAAQLEYLITLNKTLQNLVYEELSKTFTPAKEDAKNTQVRDLPTISNTLRNVLVGVAVITCAANVISSLHRHKLI
jgi:hypothetical protein